MAKKKPDKFEKWLDEQYSEQFMAGIHSRGYITPFYQGVADLLHCIRVEYRRFKKGSK